MENVRFFVTRSLFWLHSLSLFPSPNKGSCLPRLRWKIPRIIRQGAVIYVFQNSDHIDESTLVRQWLENVRFFVTRSLFWLHSLSLFPSPNKGSCLPRLRWKIPRIIRQGAVIYVFQNSDHIDESTLVRQWLENVRFFVTRPLFWLPSLSLFPTPIKSSGLICLRLRWEIQEIIRQALWSIAEPLSESS